MTGETKSFMSLRGFEPAEGGTATLHRLNEQLDGPGKNHPVCFFKRKFLKSRGVFVKPAGCSRPPMEHVYAAEADDRGRSFWWKLGNLSRLVRKTILFWTLVITVISYY